MSKISKNDFWLFSSHMEKETKDVIEILRRHEVCLKRIDKEYHALRIDYKRINPAAIWGYNLFGDYEIKVYSDTNPSFLKNNFVLKNFPVVNIDEYTTMNSLETILEQAKIDVEVVPLAFAINQVALRYLKFHFWQKGGNFFCDSASYRHNEYNVVSDYNCSHLTKYGRRAPPIKIVNLKDPFYKRIGDNIARLFE